MIDMTRKADVLCVGQAVIDCITRNVYEDSRVPGRTQAESITLNPGGDALNESFALAQMGVRTGLMCTVGNDLAGRFIRDEAARRGIDTSFVSVSDTIVTPVADMFVSADGSRSSITSRATALPGYRPDAERMKEAKIVSLASLFRAPLDDPEVIRDLIGAAHAGGALICADTKMPTLKKVGLSELGEALSMIDYLFPNETEAAYYTGKQTVEEMGDALLGMGIRHVVIKMGEKGCYACGAGERRYLSAVEVPVVDTTGAGDNFAAGFITGLLAGDDFMACCGRGLSRASVCVQRLGANGDGML